MRRTSPADVASPVKQVRVAGNIMWMWLLWVLVVWGVRHHIWTYPVPLALGFLLGVLYGWLRWGFLVRRIQRQDRRYARNKIFVQYLHSAEVVLTFLAYYPYFTLPLGLGLLLLIGAEMAGFTHHAARAWLVGTGSMGLSAASVLVGKVGWYDYRHGPLYYQYDSASWSGAEGMLYQHGVVIQALTPHGKVKMPGGVLWNAVSLSGEAIASEMQVEVIAVRGLTLYVDGLPGTVQGEQASHHEP